jgi:hypothetical protein
VENNLPKAYLAGPMLMYWRMYMLMDFTFNPELIRFFGFQWLKFYYRYSTSMYFVIGRTSITTTTMALAVTCGNHDFTDVHSVARSWNSLRMLVQDACALRVWSHALWITSQVHIYYTANACSNMYTHGPWNREHAKPCVLTPKAQGCFCILA